jgi:hypothetical protein
MEIKNKPSKFKIVSAVTASLVLVASTLLEDRLVGWGNGMIDKWLATHQGDLLSGFLLIRLI